MKKADLASLLQVLDIAKSTQMFSQEELECLAQDLGESIQGLFPDDHFLTIEAEHKILGFVHFGPMPITNGAWCLYWICVDKTAHGKGIGKKMLAEVERKVKKLGGRMLFIETSAQTKYEDTRAFYLKCGYAAVATIPDFYSMGDGKTIFSKPLLMKG